MKYYLIAGEASGDLHGSNLIRELRQLDTQASIRCWGGDLMEAAGATVVKHYRDLAFMGFIEVVQNLRTILNNLSLCKKDIAAFQPDVVVLVDYPGFNLRIAKWAKEQGFPVIYYISPQVWAWKESRVKLIRKVVDKMLVILPFEEAFFNKWDYKVTYVGHPLVQVVEDFEKIARKPVILQPGGQMLSSYEEEDSKKLILLLPGSRKQEILVKLPIMLETSRNFPELTFVIGQAPAQPYALYEKLIADYPNVQLAAPGQTYTLLSAAQAALVTSGTATLETALFGVPQVVCYKGSAISYHIAKRLLKIKYISLVNLIMDQAVVTELIQHELTPEKLTAELKELLYNKDRINKLENDYQRLKKRLQEKGNASARAAQEIVGYLQGHQ